MCYQKFLKHFYDNLNLQGYVGAGACFESKQHCLQFLRILNSPYFKIIKSSQQDIFDSSNEWQIQMAHIEQKTEFCNYFESPCMFLYGCTLLLSVFFLQFYIKPFTSIKYRTIFVFLDQYFIILFDVIFLTVKELKMLPMTLLINISRNN